MTCWMTPLLVMFLIATALLIAWVLFWFEKEDDDDESR